MVLESFAKISWIHDQVPSSANQLTNIFKFSTMFSQTIISQVDSKLTSMMHAHYFRYFCVLRVLLSTAGWESQLLETGFLAIWLVPVFNIQLLPVNTPTSRLCIYGYRWLVFRIMIGAGLIKVGFLLYLDSSLLSPILSLCSLPF